MAFGLSMRSVQRVQCYDDAVAMYNKATAWKNGGDDLPFPNKRAREYGIRMEGTDVVFRYHRTDVVTWHADGSYTIKTGGYDTGSTCTFANNFMPRNHSLGRQTKVLRIGETLYPISGTRLTVSPDGVPSGGLGKFTKKKIKLKEAKKLRESFGYPEYRKWHKAMFPMIKDTMVSSWHREYLTYTEIVERLADPDKWHSLMVSQFGHPDDVRTKLYDKNGHAFDIYEHVYLDKLQGFTEGRDWDIE